MAEMQIAGLAELTARLKEMSAEVAVKSSRQALGSVAYRVVTEARQILKQNGSVRTGTLLKNISAAREKRVSPGEITFKVGVRHGKRAKGARKVATYRGTRKSVKYENDPYYFFMLEFGTKKMPARPYLRPAFDAVSTKARDILAKRLTKSIDRFRKGAK